MKEQLTDGKTEFERNPNLLKVPEMTIEAASDSEIAAIKQTTEAQHGQREEARTEAASLARTEVHDVIDEKTIEDILTGIDFSDDKYSFSAANQYAADAKTFATNTTSRGHLRNGPWYGGGDAKRHMGNAWGDPRNEAHYARQPVEQVGIRKLGPSHPEYENKQVLRKGIAGKLGLKKTERVQKPQRETQYFFDYSFNAPSHGDEAARRAGNNTGQDLRLSLELTKDQAESLSKIIAENPKAARTMLDTFMQTTGDAGKWDAELYDDEGNFYDPGARYGADKSNIHGASRGVLEARDVRPQYDAVPGLEPRIVGLVDVEPARESIRALPAA